MKITRYFKTSQPVSRFRPKSFDSDKIRTSALIEMSDLFETSHLLNK